MRIGLIDVDSRNFPNLALMKISAWHKGQGDLVEWYMPFGERYDRVYMSKVFSFSPDYDDAINADDVIKGGTGYCIEMENGREVFRCGRNVNLPYEVEHIYPDYSLYPQRTKDTAYGFLTRGCPRGCDFCIVGLKEGRKAVKVADLTEFWKGQKNVVLCDPNILACKEWQELLQQLIDAKVRVDFNQGLDIRLMTEEKAEMFKRLRYKEIHFAWDKYEEKDIVLPKLRMFADICGEKVAAHNAMVFTITNFNTTFEQDLERIYTLREMGYWPYVAIYNKPDAADEYRRLQRWVNNRFIFGACERFEDYKY